MQAKVLYQMNKKAKLGKGVYGGLKVGGQQSRDLIAMSGDLNPIYVFYNHPKIEDAYLFQPSGPPDHFGETCWGCSVATAEFVSSRSSNELSKLIHGMVPWHRFFGIGKTCRTKEAMKKMPGEQQFKLAKFRPEWVDMLLNESDLPGDDAPSDLSEVLTERRLGGVAYIKVDD